MASSFRELGTSRERGSELSREDGGTKLRTEPEMMMSTGSCLMRGKWRRGR